MTARWTSDRIRGLAAARVLVPPGASETRTPLGLVEAVATTSAPIAWAGAAGSFALTVMMPVMAHALLASVHVLSTSAVLLAERCVDGITADAERMRRYAESSPSVVTPLNAHIGYEEAAKVAKKALADGATIRDTVIEMGYVERGDLTEEQLDAALDVDSMTGR